MSRGPAQIYEQPQEGLPSGIFDLKILELEKLRGSVRRARTDYLLNPTPANEAVLRRLVAQADALTCDIAFGIAPEISK